MYYYVALASKSHAFLLEQRMRMEKVPCEITYMPREIMTDLCNMGVKFTEEVFPQAVRVIKRSGLPGCRLFKEEILPYECLYHEVSF